MCKRCLDGIVDPLNLLTRYQDPCSDARLQQMGSISLRIGPVVGPDFTWGGGVEPALRFRSLMEKPDKASVPSFVEEYLAGMGIGLHVWGYESIPQRTLVWRVVEECEGLESESELWARASVRMGNLHSLTVMAAAKLPVDESWLSEFMEKRSKAALRLYSRSERYPAVARVARSNLAMLHSWMGRSEDAIKTLDELIGEQMDEENVNLIFKKAMVLRQSGRREECATVLEAIPDELMSWRAKRFRSELEGRR